MSSPFQRSSFAIIGAATLALAACRDESVRSNSTPAEQLGPQPVAVSALFPGGGKAPSPDPTGLTYVSNKQAISEGKRLFGWYNCSGCHFNGGGGIGPALMDNNWIYGGTIDQIYASINQGRPNGMPMWGGKIPAAGIWALAAYVHSLPMEAAKMPVPTQPTAAVTMPMPTAADTATAFEPVQ